MTYLIIGLGNPGKKYAGHRHNIGFMAIDALAKQHDFPAWKKKFSGELAEGNIDGHKTILLKPQTFMNLSGESVVQAANFYKIPLENIIVIHDEIDFEFRKAKLKKSGGAAGHNGIKSIEAHLGNDFIRVRLGVGKPALDDVSNYVLSDFSAQEIPEVHRMLSELSVSLFPSIKKFLEMGAKNLVLDLTDEEKSVSVSAKNTNMDPGLRRDDGKK